MITREFKLYLNAGVGVAPVINANQFDQDEEWIFTLLQSDGTVYTPSTGAIIGLKQDGTTILNAGTVNSSGQVVITETEQMTAVPGSNLFEILIDGNTHGTANFVVFVERRPGDIDNPSESDISLFQEAIEAAGNVTQFQADISALQSGLATTNANLTSEANTRASADATLQSNISAEASTRQTQDAVLQAEIDQIIAPTGEAPSAAEVQNARIGVDGTTYDTLGNAIRTQVGDLKNALTPIAELVTGINTTCVMANGTLQNTGNLNAVYTSTFVPVESNGKAQIKVTRPLSAEGNYYKFGWIIYDSEKNIHEDVQIIYGNTTGLVDIPNDRAFIRYSIYEYNADETLHTLRKTDFDNYVVSVESISPENLVDRIDDLDERVEALENPVSPVYEYKYYGEKIDKPHGVNFTQYSWYMPSPTVGEANSLQAIALYNDRIFQFLPNNKCVSFPFGSPSNRTVFDATCGHGNSAEFSASKYDESDTYPICYVSDWLKTDANKVYALRLTDTSATLIKTYTFPFADAGYYAGACLDNEKNIMYLIGYSKPNAEQNVDNENHLIVSAWDMTSETNNGDGTYSYTKIGSFKVPVFVTTMQDRCFKFGKIFILSSPSGKPTTIYCVSPQLQQIVSVMDDFPAVFKTQELEGMAFMSDEEMFLTYYGRPWKATF